MKKINKLTAFAVLLLSFSMFLWSCKKDDKDDETTEEVSTNFEFIVSSNYIINDTNMVERKWALIYSQNNELLAMQELQNSKSYVFKSLPEDLNIQLISYRDYLNNDNHIDNFSFNTYTHIDPSVWKLGQEYEDDLEPIGAITADLTDIPFNDYDFSVISASYYGSWGSNIYDNVFEIKQYYNPDKVWLSLNNIDRGLHQYAWFPNIALNESLSINSNQLQHMDALDVEFPVNTDCMLYLEGDDLSTDIGEWYEIYYDFQCDGQTSVKAYYPNNVFNGYWTYYKAQNENIRNYMISNMASIPDKFETINTSITISNESIHNFNATINGSSDYCYYYWSASENAVNFSYYVYGAIESAFSFVAPPIPSEIVALNSQLLVLDNLGYSAASFRDYSLLSGYDAFIKASKVDQAPLYKGGYYLYNYIYNYTKDIEKFDDKEMIRQIKQEHYNY